jgi:hypothetical protein
VNLINFSPIKQDRLRQIRDETSRDTELTTLMETIARGWPDHKDKLPMSVVPYFNYRDELSMLDGIVLRGERVVIPKSMRREMKDKVHAGHLGIKSCLRRARELIFWPRMSAEIREFIESCSTCATFADRQSPETLYLHEVPKRPWKKLVPICFPTKRGNIW